MALQSHANLYPGINAHLNSLIQNEEGEWESFHGTLIVDLTRALNRVLPDGYEARSERSLQIREGAHAQERIRRPRPDVTVFAPSAVRQAGRPAAGSAPALPVLETLDVDPEAFLAAVIIYEVRASEKFGRPVTRVELLSPTNKPQGAGYPDYREKRSAAVAAGLPLVEIDLLHESDPVVMRLPSYRLGQPNASAYTVVVSDPRPSLHEGLAYIHAFNPGEACPLFDVPLAGADVLRGFDLLPAYNMTFEQSRTYPRLVDYSVEPVRFHTYSPEDQGRIRAVMAHAAQQAARGD